MKKFKIVIFHLAFLYSGGGEKLVLQEAKGLKKLGYDVSIYTCVINRRRCFPDIIGKFAIKTFLPKLPPVIPDRDSFQILLTCVLAPFLAPKFAKFDLILACNQPSPWIAWWVKKFFGVPYISYLAQPTRVLYLREIDKKTGLVFTKKETVSVSAKLIKLALKFVKWADFVSIVDSNLVLANGDYIRKVLARIYQINPTSCPAGITLKREAISWGKRLKGMIKINGYQVKKPYLLITNRHFAQKRFEYGIFTLPFILANFANISLVITGQPTDYTQELAILANRLNLAGKVNFLGYVTEKSLEKLYSNAAVYLYTAPEEDFGMGIVEAAAAGTPVVAWKNAGPAKIVKNGETGFLVKLFDVFAFSKNILKIVSNDELAIQLSRQAREQVESKFSYQNHIKTIDNAIKGILEE